MPQQGRLCCFCRGPSTCVTARAAASRLRPHSSDASLAESSTVLEIGRGALQIAREQSEEGEHLATMLTVLPSEALHVARHSVVVWSGG